MLPTTENRTWLRKLLSEKIQAGHTDADTRFLDTELDQIIGESVNIYAAASKGWSLKAAILQEELGQIEQYSIGDETYKKVNLTTMINSALTLSKQYESMTKSNGAVIMKIKPPEVL